MRQFTVMVVSFFLWCTIGISSGTAEQTPAGLLSSLEERVDGRPMNSSTGRDGDPGNESKTVPPHAFPGSFSQNDLIAAVEPAARYYEAIAFQDHDQAWRFHDRVFEQQEDLSRRVETIKEIVVALEIDHARLEADLHSDNVEQRLTTDRLERERFGFDGTPAFVINGV